MQITFDLTVNNSDFYSSNLSSSGRSGTVRDSEIAPPRAAATEISSNGIAKTPRPAARRRADHADDRSVQGFEGWLYRATQSQSSQPVAGDAGQSGGSQLIPHSGVQAISAADADQTPQLASDHALRAALSLSSRAGLLDRPNAQPLAEGLNSQKDESPWLGQAADVDGIHPLRSEVQALENAAAHRVGTNERPNDEALGDLTSAKGQGASEPGPGGEQLEIKSTADGLVSNRAQNQQAQLRGLQALRLKGEGKGQRPATGPTAADPGASPEVAEDFKKNGIMQSFVQHGHEVTAVDRDTRRLSEQPTIERSKGAELSEPVGTLGSQHSATWIADADWSSHRSREALEPTRELPSISQQIAREIVSRADSVVRQGRTEFSMRLEPPELGTVRVHLTATDHAVSARFLVANESVRHVVESQLNVLRQSLADAGMSLQRFDVSHGGQDSSHGQSNQESWRLFAPPQEVWSMRTPTTARATSAPVARRRIDVIV